MKKARREKERVEKGIRKKKRKKQGKRNKMEWTEESENIKKR